MSNFESSYKIVLNELQKISILENFYYKPIKPKLSDLELISLIILSEYKSIDRDFGVSTFFGTGNTKFTH